MWLSFDFSVGGAGVRDYRLVNHQVNVVVIPICKPIANQCSSIVCPYFNDYLGVPSLLENSVRSMTPPSVLQTHVSSRPGAGAHCVPDGSPATPWDDSNVNSCKKTMHTVRYDSFKPKAFVICMAEEISCLLEVLVGGSAVLPRYEHAHTCTARLTYLSRDHAPALAPCDTCDEREYTCNYKVQTHTVESCKHFEIDTQHTTETCNDLH